MKHLSQSSMVIALLIKVVNDKLKVNKEVRCMSQSKNKIGRGTLILSLTSFLFFLVLAIWAFSQHGTWGYTTGITIKFQAAQEIRFRFCSIFIDMQLIISSERTLTWPLLI